MIDIIETLELSPSGEELSYLKNAGKIVVLTIEKELKKQKICAEVFIGGSFAKGTIMKSNTYDIDIFVRFCGDCEEGKISELLGKVVNCAGRELGKEVKMVHGSRDYFQIPWDGKVTFEIVPVMKIKKPVYAKNVTDLSYFHVSYVKRKLKNNKKLIGDILITKKFCKAWGFYGAESYIGGFSGYALECLILYYRCFMKMLRELVKIKKDDKIVIDIEKKFKNRGEILISLNESKTQGPIVFVDPTWKERNVLASLSFDTFEKFKAKAKEFLKKPGKEFFEKDGFVDTKIRRFAEKNSSELIVIELKTDRQEGDIAGTKMKKFFGFLGREIEKYFCVVKKVFAYSGIGQESKAYYVVKPKKEIIKSGPCTDMADSVCAFKKANKNVFEKNGRVYARIEIGNCKDFLENWVANNRKIVGEMGISNIEV